MHLIREGLDLIGRDELICLVRFVEDIQYLGDRLGDRLGRSRLRESRHFKAPLRHEAQIWARAAWCAA